MAAPNIELLLDRLLSASTPSDCLDSLDELQKVCRSSSNNNEGDADNLNVIDAIVKNASVLRALCNLLSSSTLPPIDGEGEGMKIEGGEIGAAELLLALLPETPKVTTDAGKGMTSDDLKRQRTQQRRIESISKSLLHFHQNPDPNAPALQDVALIPSLLDCLCSPASTYARVLSLQILSALLEASPGALREQLMQAPDGINRLVDLLGYSPNAVDPEEEVPEEVRNAAILFLSNLASSSSVLARLITFSEGYSRALKIGLETPGPITIDCLQLCLALATADDVGRELFLGGGDGRGNLERLAMLMDLRRGERFGSSERNMWWSEELRKKRLEKGDMEKQGGNKVTSEGSKAEDKKKSKRGKQRKDDLDDILSGADAVSTKVDDTKLVSSNVPLVPDGPPVPYLTPNEATIIGLICDLLLALLYDGESPDASRSVTEQSAVKRRARAKEIASHDLLTRSIVDCALYTLPPPGVDFVSAVPPPDLQQKSLMVMAVLGSMGDTILEKSVDGEVNSKSVEEETKLQTHLLFETMPLYLQGRVTAMERLMYLACTGAYRPQNEEDDSPEATASLISLSAIAVFRSCLPAETACRMVLHALAPPPPDEAEEAVAPLEMPVVTKLVTTLAENLRFLQSNQHLVPTDGTENPEFDITTIYSAAIGASGAAYALGVLLTKGEGDATREMLLRMAPPSSPPLEPDEIVSGLSEPISASNLIDFSLQFIASCGHSGNCERDDQSISGAFQRSVASVTLSLLKLLAEWTDGMPKAVSEILSSPSSVSLGVLVRSKSIDAVPAMSGLLLGLCLDYIADKGSSNSLTNVENFAWNKDTIVNMIQSMGVGKYFSMLDEWRKKSFPLPYCSGDKGPILERRAASTWYGKSVTQVRRRIVATIAGDSGENEADSDGEGEESNPSTRNLRKMVKSQAKEMEELQSKLEQAMHTIENQSSQIKSLKRVAELGTSAETNDMLAEYEEKIAELEKEKVQIKIEAETVSTSQKEELISKDQRIASLEEDLRQAKIAAEESERDKETLSEEMAGLSAAYNSLEQEYRSSSFNSASDAREMTAGGETAIEGGGSTSVPGGEAAAEDPTRSNHQLQALQDENARLREDVRAANEWMAMAVSKMDELGHENESLSTSLQEAQNNTTVLPSFLKEKDDELAQQKATIKNLEERNEEAQQWIDSAVTRFDTLTKELHELKSRNGELEAATTSQESAQSELEDIKAQNASLTAECATLQGNLAEFQSWSETAQARIAEMEAALQEVTTERDELKNTPCAPSEDVTEQVESLRAELSRKSGELDDAQIQLEQVQSQLIEESDANEAVVDGLRNELEQQKQLTDTIISERDELLAQAAPTSEIDSSQNRISELEALIEEVKSERDELKLSLQSSSTCNDEQIQSLQSELNAKYAELEDVRSQLEQVQSQLIEESDANEESIEKLRNELDSEKQRLGVLLSEKDELTANLSSKQAEIDSSAAENANLNAQIERLNQSIADLETAKKAAESHAEDLIQLSTPQASNMEDELIAMTAERNDIKSHFDDLTEEYEQTKQDLERIQMENGNLMARNRALEQDNKSLEYQFTEASSKCAELAQLQTRITELEETINLSLEEKTELQEALDDMQNSSEDAVKQWKERAEELESNIASLESQLKEQEDEAVEAIAQWEARCSALEGNGEDAVQQWQDRAQSLESDVTALQSQVASLTEKNGELERSLADSAQRMQTEIAEKDEAIASYDEQIELLTKEIISTREESEQVVKQWQDRSEELEANINELNESLGNQQDEATDVISQWEARCAALNERIEELEIQLTSQDPIAEKLQANLTTANETLAGKEAELARVTAQKENQVSSLLTELEDTRNNLDRLSAEHELLRQTLSHKESEHADQLKHIEAEKNEALRVSKTTSDGLNARIEELQRSLAESENHLELKEKEWSDKEASLNAKIAEVETNKASSSQSSATLQEEIECLKEKYHVLEHERSELELKKDEFLRNNEESNTLIFELKEELRRAQEELQLYAKDDLTARANEIASSALRDSMLEVRSQYEADRKALASEKELRLEAEKTVEKLKSDLALLSQATEYDENVDLQVRKIAKKMLAENTRKERQEMEELRLALDQLKEELGTCRFKEREAEEKAANARLQKSILEQEVCAAKSDMALMEQAIEDLETSKIDVCVSMEYRIETLLNERTSLEKEYQEEFAAAKSELARLNQENGALIHKLEQSEKANAALTLNTIAGEENQSEVVRLQLERAQLLAKITEIGVDSERRVKEAVAAHASSAEAELIIEKQAKQSVESSLADALSELEELKSDLLNKSEEYNPENDIVVTELRESLAEMQLSYRELQAANEELNEQIANGSLESESIVQNLKDKLLRAEAQLRSEERENRFETALASEIARLRSDVSSQNKNILSPGVLLSPEKESISENVLAMHEYVVELRGLLEQERQSNQSILEERDEALALIGLMQEDMDLQERM